jgi:hypothetical protein
MLYREIVAVCSEIHTKHTNTLRVEFWKLTNHKFPLQMQQFYDI